MGAASLGASLRWLASSGNGRQLARGLRGFEKECLRVTPDGRLALTPHSPKWGSALTHPYLTTDYSEALLEFVTPPLDRAESALAFLDEMQAFVVSTADDELLWPASMPCIIGRDESVPIAQYGSSNEGRLRTIYRSGLGLRYGRSMQAIAGVHFNFSLAPAFWSAFHDFAGDELDLQRFRSEKMMGLVRNFRRIGWLVTYLYGASPAFCRSFRPDGHPGLEPLSRDTWYAPHSTSLRMSDMGYRNSTQSRLGISVNSLDEYVDELARALTTREPGYEKIGVVEDGAYRQLSANVLQLENEYYSSIRPKPASKSPRLIAALRATGVEYVEVRTLDLNPFDRLGVTVEQAKLVELLLLTCLLSDSHPISAAEQREIDQRELAVAWEGRKPGLSVQRQGRELTMNSWALEITDQLEALAELVDGEDGAYSAVVHRARAAVLDSGETFSARVLEALESGGKSFFEWALAIAQRNRLEFLNYQFAPGRRAALESLAEESLSEARAIESADAPPFEEFLASHLSLGIMDSPQAGTEICD